MIGRKMVIVESDGITFQLRNGTSLFIPAQEFYELLVFIAELKSASEKRRREVLGGDDGEEGR